MAQKNAVQQTPFWYNFLLTCIKPLYRWKIKQRAENAAALNPMALALLASGMVSEITDNINAPKTPPKAPATMRAANSI